MAQTGKAGRIPAERAHMVSPAPSISITDLKVHCQSCSLRELCLPVGLSADEMREFDSLVVKRAKLARNEALYRVGQPFRALYAVRVGSLKTKMLVDDGRQQVAGYHMPGEILGLDGVGANRHLTEAIALESTEVCVIPFAQIEDMARRMPAFQQTLHKVMSREIAEEQHVMLLLGTLSAEERVATLLLNLADRYRNRGYSSVELVLRMTREEIGSYLGIKLETVSRLLSRLQDAGMIQVQGRVVKILDPSALRRSVGHRF